MTDTTEKVILSVQLDQGDAVTKVAQLTTEINKLKEANKQLDQTTEEGAKQIAENNALIKDATRDRTALQKQIQNSIIVQGNEIKTIEQARAANQLLREERNKVDLTTKQGQQRLVELNKEIDRNDKLIRENVDSYTQQKINIGNYASALEGIGGPFGRFIGFLRRGKESLQGVKDGIDTSKTSFAGFNNLLKASAIGLIITLLAGLIASLSKFEPLMDKVSAVVAGANAVLDVFIQRLINIGQGLIEIFSGNFTEGIDQVRNSFVGMGDAMADAAKDAYDLREALDALEDKQRAQIILNAEANKEVTKLLLQAKNRTLSEKERLAFLDQASRIERRNFEQNKRLAEEEYNIALRNAKLKTQLNLQEIEELLTNTERREELEKRIGTLTGKELDTLADLKAKIINLEQDSVNLQEKIVNRRDALMDAAVEKEIKRQEAAQKAQEKTDQAAQKALEQRLKRQEILFQQTEDYRSQKFKEANDELKFASQEQELFLLEQLTKRNMTQEQFDAALLTIQLGTLEKEKEILIQKGEVLSDIDLQIARKKKEISDKSTNDLSKSTKAQQDLQVQSANALNQIINEAANAAGEAGELQKAAALTQLSVNLGTALTNLTATTSAPTPDNVVTGGISGFVKYATFLAQILSTFSQARSLIGGAAAGGGNFMTKGPTLLLVGDNPGGVERVSVEPVSGRGKTTVSPGGNLVAMAGGGTLIADGGFGARNMAGSMEVIDYDRLAQSVAKIKIISKFTDLKKVQANDALKVQYSEL
jgi:hypothetical protein